MSHAIAIEAAERVSALLNRTLAPGEFHLVQLALARADVARCRTLAYRHSPKLRAIALASAASRRRAAQARG